MPCSERWCFPTAPRSTPGTCRLPSSEIPSNRRLNGLYEEEVRQFKKRLIVRTLRECGWRKAESARVLGVARGYLHRLINQLEIREPEEILAEDRARQSGPRCNAAKRLRTC